MDYYMHVLPGRIRIRTSEFRRNKAGILSASQFLKSMGGVICVKTNDAIGSLLIDHDRSVISSQVIVHQLAQNGFFPGINFNGPKVRSFHPSAVSGR